MDEQTLYRLALPLVKGIGVVVARQLESSAGSAELLFKGSNKQLSSLPNMRSGLLEVLKDPEPLRRAEKELTFCINHNINILHHTDHYFPAMLKGCADAPYSLFYKGDLNALLKPSIAVIGTRNSTEYGRAITESFARELKESLPEYTIVSGLAYGVDIAAHRAALHYDIPTIGVLAHGLDRIYPPTHRGTAAEMLRNGGLLTEYMSGTNPDKPNFVHRNRIVAGISSAIVLIESKDKGGAMITVQVGKSYGRPIFAYPGRVGDLSSIGCNKLISTGEARLISSINDLIEHMSLNRQVRETAPIQKKLFIELSKEEESICKIINSGEERADEISHLVGIPIYKLRSILVEMEMKGVLQALPGGIYKII
ncbi:MAG: DNA-processing protein DprA [Bacteroidales bacterium]